MILVHKSISFQFAKPKSHTNVDGQGWAKGRGGRWTCNPAVDRQPGLRRPGLAEQQCFSLGLPSLPSTAVRPTLPPSGSRGRLPLRTIFHLFAPELPFLLTRQSF